MNSFRICCLSFCCIRFFSRSTRLIIIIAVMICQWACHIVISLLMPINLAEYLFIDVLITSLVKLIECIFSHWKLTVSLIDIVWYTICTKPHFRLSDMLIYYEFQNKKHSKRTHALWTATKLWLISTHHSS